MKWQEGFIVGIGALFTQRFDIPHVYRIYSVDVQTNEVKMVNVANHNLHWIGTSQELNANFYER